MTRIRIAIVLAAIVAALIVGMPSAASAKAVRLESADRPSDKTLSYVEPVHVRKGTPKRLYVEFADGSTWSFTPCRVEDGRNCFWWASTMGVPGGNSFIDLRGRTYYLH